MIDPQVVPDVAGHDIGAERFPDREVKPSASEQLEQITNMILDGERYATLYRWARERRGGIPDPRRAARGPLQAPEVVDVGDEQTVYGSVVYPGES